ncbi:MAG TPA: hypothetical protein VNW94_09570, partial [Streptosporangiaceae bacterium]|nr:hypothetical protein [Streptosporangiaceae bacterium]
RWAEAEGDSDEHVIGPVHQRQSRSWSQVNGDSRPELLPGALIPDNHDPRLGVAMAFKLIESAQARWRAVNAPHLVALVRAGARFEDGKLVERPDESGGDNQAA